MYTAHQQAAWDHTAMMLATMSHKPVDPQRLNPFRRRRAKRARMRPVELHALAKALEARNATFAGD